MAAISCSPLETTNMCICSRPQSALLPYCRHSSLHPARSFRCTHALSARPSSRGVRLPVSSLSYSCSGTGMTSSFEMAMR
eukprot:2204598-Pleurochrysis_carterae.AAC.1